MNFTEPTFCSLCGWTDKRDLRYGLVHWRDAEPGMAYANVPRCSDVTACRARVRSNGETWPLVESKNDRRSA
jgi:hypothetical protein